MGTLYRTGSPGHAAVVAASLLVILAALLPSGTTAQGLSPATYIRLTFITRPTTASVKTVVLQQVPSATASDTDTFDLPSVGEMAVTFNGTKAQTQYTELVAYLSGNPTALAQMTLSKFLRETAAVVTPAPPGIVTPSPGGVTPIPTVSLPPQSGGSDEFPAWGIVLITIGIIIVMAVGGFIGVQWYMSRSLEETEEKIEKLERRRSSETRRESRVTFQPHGAFGSEEEGPAGNDGIELRPVANVGSEHDVEVVDGGATTSHHPSDKYRRGSAIAHDTMHGQEKDPADLPPEVVTREMFLQKNSSDYGTGEQPQHQALDTNGNGNGEHHVIRAESGEAAGTGYAAALGSQLVRTTISGQQLSPPGAAAVEHDGSQYDHHLAHHDDADHDGAAPPAQGSYSPREDGGDAGVVFATAQQEEGGGGGIEVDDDDDEGVVEVAEDTPGGDYPIDIR